MIHLVFYLLNSLEMPFMGLEIVEGPFLGHTALDAITFATWTYLVDQIDAYFSIFLFPPLLANTQVQT